MTFLPFLILVTLIACSQSKTVVTKAQCNLRLHNNGKDIGLVTLTKGEGIVEIDINIKSDKLKAGKHGFHIHQYGVLTGNDCASTGGHFNPMGHPHAGPKKKKRHVGDLGNVIADTNGAVVTKLKDKVVKLKGPKSVLGRAIVIHEGKDDLGKGGNEGSRTTGNAGPRVACCTIAVSQDSPVDSVSRDSSTDANPGNVNNNT